MKRVIEFFVCLIVVFSIVYMKPVVSAYKNPKPKNDLSIEKVKMTHKSVPYYELNTTGMANHIGKTKDEFLKEFPNPKKTWLSYDKAEWLVYGDSTKDYYQVEIKNHVVASVFVLGSTVDSTPFTMDMNLVDLAEITTIFSNFNFEYGDEKYEVELTEDDMNYRPLVAFNNDTFAILHMNQLTGKLLAIRYLDKQTLLSIMPYQMEQENHVKEKNIDEGHDSKKINDANREQLTTLLNLFREKDEKRSYHLDTDLQVKATKGIQILTEKPETIITSEDHFSDWEKIMKQQSEEIFLLENEELTKLTKEVDLKNKKNHAIFYAPVTDVPFMITNWYGSRFYHEEIDHKRDSTIGMAFDKDKTLIFFGEEEKKQTTESSGKL
ncbi:MULTISPECIES: CAP-associated domain-containing protein [Vagococcus]|nr:MULTISPECIES: CAP-associated domain-containing protein [Vagococcus]